MVEVSYCLGSPHSSGLPFIILNELMNVGTAICMLCLMNSTWQSCLWFSLWEEQKDWKWVNCLLKTHGFIYFRHRNVRFKCSWVKEGLVTGNRKSYSLTFLKEDGYFFLSLFLSCPHPFLFLLFSYALLKTLISPIGFMGIPLKDIKCLPP